jgi:Raf kinase inhibitor-like YbhB/YbcL family protein
MPYKSEMRAILPYCIAAAFVCALASRVEAGGKLALSSRAFSSGSTIPIQYTCGGDNQSPPLHWSGVPTGARSLALIVKDPDAPGGTFIHWVIYNIPPDRSSLPKGVPGKDNIPGGGEQGLNGRDETGYHGPCPPPGRPHHYHFQLYALDKKLDLKPGASARQVEDAMGKHVLAETDMVGMFGR